MRGRELSTLVVMDVTRMRISADPCGTIRKRNVDLGIARCIDEVHYGGCRILYRLFILSRFCS